MWHKYFQNMTFIIAFTFLVLKIKQSVLGKYLTDRILSWLLPISAGIFSCIAMLSSFSIGSLIFDLRSIPIFLITIHYGWVYGIIGSIIPIIFRMYLGGPYSIHGVILGLVFPLLVGGLGYKPQSSSYHQLDLPKTIKYYFYYIFSAIIFGYPFLGLPLWAVIKIYLSQTIFGLGIMVSTIFLINDVNGRIQLQKGLEDRHLQLVKEKEKLNHYLDIAEVFFMVLDLDQRIRLVNKKASQIIGQAKEELLGKHWYECIITNKDDLQEVTAKMLTGELKPLHHEEFSIYTVIGEERTILWNSALLHDHYGRIEGLVTSGLDVTERKILSEELEHNKLQQEFFANLSHEMRTPLNLITSALQMIDLFGKKHFQEAENERVQRYTKILKINVYRMLRLVDNLLDITKINMNHFRLNLQHCDIVALLNSLFHSVEGYLKNNSRKLHYESTVDQLLIVCDPLIIERIILNLFSNAIKYTEPGDQITMSLAVDGEKVFIAIKDTGIGIPKTVQKVIFQKFRQVDKSFSRKQEGSGLGLYMVKALTELHGGIVKVNSEYGQGSEFIIELPIAPPSINQIHWSSNISENTINQVEIEFSDIYQ